VLEAGNYRPVSVLSAISKIIENSLENLLYMAMPFYTPYLKF
jgi:hypothetical protein